MTCSPDEPILIDKECTMCKQRKLLSAFDLAHKSKDKRTSICKSCEEEKRNQESEFCCDGPGHTNMCLTNKTLEVMSCELENTSMFIKMLICCYVSRHSIPHHL
jgi:hypothetical protein